MINARAIEDIDGLVKSAVAAGANAVIGERTGRRSRFLFRANSLGRSRSSFPDRSCGDLRAGGHQ